jgi:phosphoribosyl 1,2-cyclic phosphodiesterase
MTALFPCPCCGYLTSSEPGSHDICPICDWEDDLSQLRFPRSGGGANHESLEEAQANFAKIGVKSAVHLTHVRPAGPEDVRDPLWRPLDPAGDAIEVPVRGRDYGADYPADRTELYYWRANYWRRRLD